ncbi:hypothetical protein EVG20_g9168 [Dentipellis fragilis]|uniref:Protein kinase domain-containing protein n=1 Tax=Dentipellis fragilis TaxID=205917 RepID=A0A4Y9Y195_9AGAM|nr:hypothetical protein EVG20_g9168 [Dentipellis fragilis]
MKNTPHFPPEPVAWPGWPDDEPYSEHETRVIEESDSEFSARLRRVERQWLKIQPWLQSQGYMLRPRFRPGWVPSWYTPARWKKSVEIDYCEDAIIHVDAGSEVTIDAFRVSDGRHVCLKCIPCRAEDSMEVIITEFLSQGERRKDPRNHSIPLLDVIRAPDHCFIVFPFCRSLLPREPHFDTIGEIFDLVEQALEGLDYLHGLRIAHRYASTLYHRLSYSGPWNNVCVRTRTQVGGVRYYLIDFGESIKFEPSDSSLIDVWSKASVHAPETLPRNRPPYDPFKADVYSMGSVLKAFSVQDYDGYFGALFPLFEAMMVEDPNGRPTAAAALDQFREIKCSYSRTALHRRILYQDSDAENGTERAIYDAWHWTKQCVFAISNLECIQGKNVDLDVSKWSAVCSSDDISPSRAIKSPLSFQFDRIRDEASQPARHHGASMAKMEDSRERATSTVFLESFPPFAA